MSSNLTKSLDQATGMLKRSCLPIFWFSMVVNLLLLTAPLFMLQVYDRVLISGSQETLVFLLLIAIFLLACLSIIDTIRGRLMTRISNRFDALLRGQVFEETLRRSDTAKPVRDLQSIRQFISSPYALTLFDAPWIPLFLGIIYLLHPLLGHVALAGAVLLVLFAFTNEWWTRTPLKKANEAAAAASRFADHSVRNSEAVLGMGMAKPLSEKWGHQQIRNLGWLNLVLDRSQIVSNIAKITRQLLQVGILATGAWLTLEQYTTAGVMIAASIISARALAPIEQSIQGWKSLKEARQSLGSLTEFLQDAEESDGGLPLPRPSGAISLDKASYVVTHSLASGLHSKALLQDISLGLTPGESLGVIGASGSGKTTLIRAMMGIVEVSSGEVRIDGYKVCASVREQFAEHIGYLPQNIELFPGTVADNICRFGARDTDKILEASQLAGAHEIIQELPAGYDTPIGPGGIPVSGGQRQRIALARALYGRPALVILDEPTASLDAGGQQHFEALLGTLKRQGITCITVTHQPSVLSATDRIAVLKSGRLEKLAKSAEVLQGLHKAKHKSSSITSIPKARIVSRRQGGIETSTEASV